LQTLLQDITHIIANILAELAENTPFGSGAHLAWKKGSVAEGQLVIIKTHFLLRLEIDR